MQLCQVDYNNRVSYKPLKRKSILVIQLLLWISIIVNASFQNSAYAQSPDSTLQAVPLQDTTTKTVTKGDLEEQVDYSARDSIRVDAKNKMAYLYGDAVLTYGEMKLTADFITIDFDRKIITAIGTSIEGSDSIIGMPVFEEGETKYQARRIDYNIESKKGRLADLRTQEGEGFIHGKNVKKDQWDNIYVGDAKYTTCDLDTPHYYIGAKKLKIIPGKQVITGPANLVVEGVETPLFIPFGFFPLPNKQKSGVIIPAYGNSANRGYFLSNFGYYFAISDYMNLSVTGDAYFRGSWATRVASDYNRRYRFNGNFYLSYANNLFGSKEDLDFRQSKDYQIRWTHQQDNKARPNTRFSANVNINSSQNLLNNSNNIQDIVSTTQQSSISWSKVMHEGKYNLSTNFRHSQNTTQKDVTFSLPDVSFGVARVLPFERKTQVGKKKWYENLGLSYQGNLRNQISTKDSLLFTPETLTENMRNGVSHSIPVSTSIKAFKYFTFNPSFNYNEYWYFRTIRKELDTNTNRLESRDINQFERAATYSTGANMTTRFYGMYTFNGKKILAMRHAVTPQFGFNYAPDFSEAKYGYYQTTRSDTLDATETTDYSIFEQGILGGPGTGQQGLFSFSLNNNFELKVRKGKDSTARTEKIKLIDQLSFRTAYNIFADSLKLQPIAANFRTTLFRIFSVNADGTYDPYALDSAGRRIDTYQKDVSKKLARLTRGNISVNFGLNPDLFNGKGSDDADEARAKSSAYRQGKVDFSIPWSLQMGYNFNYNKPAYEKSETQTLTFNGDVSLTKKWKVGFTSGYDLTRKELATSSFDLHRDLHCWEFSFNWIPNGYRQSFVFTINVKSTTLRDLKVNKRSFWYDQ